MSHDISRRSFIQTSAVAAAGLTLASHKVLADSSANRRVVVAIAGIGDRGVQLAKNFGEVPGVQIKYMIDVDQRRFPHAKAAQAKSKTPITLETDFRRALDDKEVDAMVIAAPDHWHAPMAILALAAGKNVYVEKPVSHNAREAELLAAAAQKSGKIVTAGTQRRSIAATQQMVQEIHDGVIGRAYFAQCFYARRRKPIGFGKKVDVPTELNWDLWQGPAPRAEYHDNVHPYNWHWFYRWGTGEAGNNMIHFVDVARWALQVTHPTYVSSIGGRLHDVGVDDWQWPDVQEIQYKFGTDKCITWFGRSINTFGPGNKANGLVIYGSKGIIDSTSEGGYTLYDLDNKVIKAVAVGGKKADVTNSKDPGLNDRHAANFIAAIRGDEKLNAPVIEGCLSTRLAHLGNISQRVGRSLKIDGATGHVLGDAEAESLWGREYQKGWEPVV